MASTYDDAAGNATYDSWWPNYYSERPSDDRGAVDRVPSYDRLSSSSLSDTAATADYTTGADGWWWPTAETPLTIAAQPSAAMAQSTVVWLFLIALYVFYGVIIVMSLLGNLLVVLAVKTSHRLSSVTHHLLASLAVADLSVTVSQCGVRVTRSASVIIFFAPILCKTGIGTRQERLIL